MRSPLVVLCSSFLALSLGSTAGAQGYDPYPQPIQDPYARPIPPSYRAPGLSFRFAPPLVTIAPGVQLVPGYRHEVFFHDGLYWMRWRGRWYRTDDWHGGWVYSNPPVPLLRYTPGYYRNWRRGYYGPAPMVLHPPSYRPPYRPGPGYRMAPGYGPGPGYRAPPGRLAPPRAAPPPSRGTIEPSPR